jgi:hypothetical protein
MKKTTNYQLNQWDETDRILREDFNEDNAKIDAAIACIDSRSNFVKIKELTTSADSAQIDVDVSDIDFSQWQQVCVVQDVIATFGGAYLFLRADNGRCTECGSDFVRNGCLSVGVTHTKYEEPCMARLTFSPALSAGRRVSVMTDNDSGSLCFGGDFGVKYLNLKMLHYKTESASYQFCAGSKFTFWGIR